MTRVNKAIGTYSFGGWGESGVCAAMLGKRPVGLLQTAFKHLTRAYLVARGLGEIQIGKGRRNFSLVRFSGLKG